MNLSPLAVQKFFDNNGIPLAGGLLFTYIAGTTTKLATYKDQAGTLNTNPIVLDYRGEANVWLDQTLTYKFTLAPAGDTDPPTRPIWTVDNISAGITLASLTAQILGQIMFPRTAAEIAAGVTPTNYFVPSHEVVRGADVSRYGADDTGAADSTTAIQNAINVMSAAGGGTVIFSEGTYRYNSQIVMKTFVNLQGAGKYSTTLKYYGSGISISARGSGVGGYPNDRKIITIADMGFNGVNANANAQFIDIGWNMRSEPMLDRVYVGFFGHYGLAFVDQNWNVSFNELQLEACGISTVNSTGIWKDPAVDVGTWNAINFHNLQVEDCGSTTSTAGGLDIRTTTANRGLHFSGTTIIEGNKGTLEGYITNMADVVFDQLYSERLNVSGQSQSFQFDGCTGKINGGYVSSSNLNFVCSFTNGSAVVTGLNSSQTSQLANGMSVVFPTGTGIPAGTTILSVQAGVGFTMTAVATATNASASLIIGFGMIGIQFKSNSKFIVSCVDALDATRWNTTGLDIQGSRIKNENCASLYFRQDASGQIYGDIAPRWSANKNGTNQVGIVTNVFTKVTFPTKTYDITNAWNAGTSTGTPITLGTYQVDAQVTWVAGTDLDRPIIAVYLNGVLHKSSISQNSGVGAYATKISVQVQITAVTDTLEIYVRQTSGVNQDIFGGAADTWLMISYVGQAA